MIPEHYQLIISDLYEENYKSNFAKDLRENIDDLTDFDYQFHFKIQRSRVGVGGIGGGFCVGGGIISNSVGRSVGVGDFSEGTHVGGTAVHLGGENNNILTTNH